MLENPFPGKRNHAAQSGQAAGTPSEQRDASPEKPDRGESTPQLSLGDADGDPTNGPSRGRRWQPSSQ